MTALDRFDQCTFLHTPEPHPESGYRISPNSVWKAADGAGLLGHRIHRRTRQSVPDSVTFRRQLRAPLSLEHSSSLAPHLFIVSFTFDSFISSKASRVSSSGILCRKTRPDPFGYSPCINKNVTCLYFQQWLCVTAWAGSWFTPFGSAPLWQGHSLPCLGCECALHLWDWSSSAIPFRVRGNQNTLLPFWQIFAKLLMKLNFFIKNRVRNGTGLKPEKVSDKDVWLFSNEVNSRNSEENYFFI